MEPFSDFIVFVDESGSPGLENPDPTFPIFVLCCILVSKREYARSIVPVIQALKFEAVGHDQLILHERDIRRQQNDFAFLQAENVRNWFAGQVNSVVRDAAAVPIACVIDKPRLVDQFSDSWSPYDIALQSCLERILARLVEADQSGHLVHVIFESRGKREDRELELAFRRIVANQAVWDGCRADFTQVRWEPKFVAKTCNSTGLQLADLFARPIGLGILRPDQTNRAFEIIRAKLGADGVVAYPA